MPLLLLREEPVSGNVQQKTGTDNPPVVDKCLLKHTVVLTLAELEFSDWRLQVAAKGRNLF